MLRFNKIYIKQKGRNFELRIDGEKLKGVRYIGYQADVESMPIVKVEFYTDDVEIEVNND